MNELTEHILAVAIKVIGGLVALWIAKKAGGVLNSLETKYDVDIDDKVEARLRLVTQKIVRGLFQSQVNGLKKSGKFDAAAQRKTLQTAMKDIKEEIKDTIFDKDSKEIEKMIEAVIAEEKKEGRKK